MSVGIYFMKYRSHKAQDSLPTTKILESLNKSPRQHLICEWRYTPFLRTFSSTLSSLVLPGGSNVGHMWLLNTLTADLVLFAAPEAVPGYAILSHVWRTDGEEDTFQRIRMRSSATGAGRTLNTGLSQLRLDGDASTPCVKVRFTLLQSNRNGLIVDLSGRSASCFWRKRRHTIHRSPQCPLSQNSTFLGACQVPWVRMGLGRHLLYRQDE